MNVRRILPDILRFSLFILASVVMAFNPDPIVSIFGILSALALTIAMLFFVKVSNRNPESAKPQKDSFRMESVSPGQLLDAALVTLCIFVLALFIKEEPLTWLSLTVILVGSYVVLKYIFSKKT